MTRTDRHLLETVNGDGIGMRVRFTRQSKQIGHAIAVVVGDDEFAVLVSQEGDSQQAFPPSPALQQMTIHRQPNGMQTAMLIGMADRNHWSVSIEAAPDGAGFLFDVACRCPESDHRLLGSTYFGQGQVPVCATETPPHCNISHDQTEYICRLTPRIDTKTGPAELTVKGTKLVVRPQRGQAASTQRWCYRLQIVKNHDDSRPFGL